MATQKSAASEGSVAPLAISFVLRHPFTAADGRFIERLDLRRGTRRDMRAANHFSKDEFEQESFLFSRLSGLAIEDLDALDLEDNAELVRRFRGLLGSPAEISPGAAQD